MSISIGFGAIRSWNESRSQKSPKIHKNPYFNVQGHPRSLLLGQSKAHVRLPINDY